MKRKKKEDLKAAVYEPFNPDELPKPLYPDITPETIEVTTLGDSFRRQIYTHPPYIIPPEYISAASGPIPEWSHTSTVLGAGAYEEMRKKYEKEVIGDVKIELKEPFKGQHVVICKDMNDLSSERVLKTLSALKGKLMIDIAPIHVQKIECRMTPEVRKNLVKAGKRLKMYGKKQPVIARFDEYGNRLPDEIALPDSHHGIKLEIVNPDDYGIFYLEMKAIEFPSIEYNAHTTPWTGGYMEDLPF